jgi:putative transposase
MERKVPFLEGENYHVYSRGVEKRKIFTNERDYKRFMALLYIMNQESSFRMDNYLQKNKKLEGIFNTPKDSELVYIQSYCLMPNHFHIVIQEKKDGNISKFMDKLLTAYSMYFNIKYERSGPLFTRPFRSVHIENDPQYMYIFSYVHLNLISIIEKDWKENGIKNIEKARQFIGNYEFSSYKDFIGETRPKSKILNLDSIPSCIKEEKIDYGYLKENFDMSDY